MTIDWITWNFGIGADGSQFENYIAIGRSLRPLKKDDPKVTKIEEVIEKGIIYYKIIFDDKSVLKIFNPSEVHFVT